jgi:hypothetical protein
MGSSLPSTPLTHQPWVNPVNHGSVEDRSPSPRFEGVRHDWILALLQGSGEWLGRHDKIAFSNYEMTHNLLKHAGDLPNNNL